MIYTTVPPRVEPSQVTQLTVVCLPAVLCKAGHLYAPRTRTRPQVHIYQPQTSRTPSFPIARNCSSRPSQQTSELPTSDPLFPIQPAQNALSYPRSATILPAHRQSRERKTRQAPTGPRALVIQTKRQALLYTRYNAPMPIPLDPPIKHALGAFR